MLNRDTQDIERDMSGDTSRCFLELQEREIEDDEFTKVDKYRNYSVNNNEPLTAAHEDKNDGHADRWI
jgi:hypothetical protein